MQYKLTAEQIREKARSIARQHAECDIQAENQILTLIEEATGEKIPEPFDEGKVRHGSVWKNDENTVVLVQGSEVDGEAELLYGIGVTCSCTQGIHVSKQKPTRVALDRGEWVKRILECDATYLGQYDFAAGLPKQ